MKDFTVKASGIRKELYIFLVSFLAALGVNIYSIVTYKTDWSEIVSQLHIVLAVAVLIYLLVLVFRILYFGFVKLIQKK